MRNYDVILFDLDGTLTDSAPGILNSVRYACRKLGLEIPSEATLRKFLGPPLIDSFRTLAGLSDAEADHAVSAFREYFPTKGIFENEVYDGVPALLADLKAAGKTVIIATSKPEDFAKRIMAHFDLAQYCDFVCGATMDETRTDKAEVIAYALETAGIIDKSRVVMVGDREHDVVGAKKNGLPVLVCLALAVVWVCTRNMPLWPDKAAMLLVLGALGIGYGFRGWYLYYNDRDQ